MAIIKPEQLGSGSYSITGSFTGSFTGDGSGLQGITATVAPAGPTTSVQFNDGLNVSGSSQFTFDKTTGLVSVTSASIGGIYYPYTDGTDRQVIKTDGAGNLFFGYPESITIRVKNVDTITLQKGYPVHNTSSGTSGNIIGVVAADAGDPLLMPAAAILNETLAPEAEGEALLSGFIQGVNTAGFTSGDVVYVAVGGGYTQTKPTGSALIQNLGIIGKVDPTNGSGIVYGSGRANDLPNITSGYAWVGNSDRIPTATQTSSFYVDSASFSTTAQTSSNSIITQGVTDNAQYLITVANSTDTIQPIQRPTTPILYSPSISNPITNASDKAAELQMGLNDQAGGISLISNLLSDNPNYIRTLNQDLYLKVKTTGTGKLFISASAGIETTGHITGSIDSSFTSSYVNPLRQTVELTGSLNITGSTLQVGNNTLLGNTTLSGSIIISGSLGTSNPTVRIYGDTQHNGYIRFDPVTTNIDTSISASYIYVSGSTNDLYFSQNGSGYSNVTRLRWLEGNLYTGLLNGGIITTQSSTVYQVSSGSGLVVDLNASYNDNPYPVITYVNWSNLSASIAPLSASYDQTFVAIQPNGTIGVSSTPYINGQIDTQIPVGVVLHNDRSTINGVKTQPKVAYGWKQRSNTFLEAFGPLKLSGLTLSVSGSSTGSLVVGSGTAFQDGANYTVDANDPAYVLDTGTNVSKIYKYRQSGSDWVYDTNAGAGYGAIDPANYSNSGVLTPVPTNNWSIQRVFYFPNSPVKAIVVYYGNAIYTTELDAIANINIEAFTEAPDTAANAVYLGALIVRHNADFTTAASYKIIPGGLFRAIGGSGGGGGSVTQTLSGLSDVSITSPTDGQPLVYNSTSLKWENLSALTANLNGNASTATSASYALTASYVAGASSFPYTGDALITGSLTVTGSIYTDSTIYSPFTIALNFETPTTYTYKTPYSFQVDSIESDPSGSISIIYQASGSTELTSSYSVGNPLNKFDKLIITPLTASLVVLNSIRI